LPSRNVSGAPAPADRSRVAIVGAGVGGLSAAHELAERGLAVTVYERSEPGGRSRSLAVPGTGQGDRRDLPGEHGFHFFPGFYTHLLDTLRRIPIGGANRSVYDNLVSTNGVRYRWCANGQTIDVAVPERWTPARLSSTIASYGAALRVIPVREMLSFTRQVAMFLTSCEERRAAEWEHVPWWTYVRADRHSGAFRDLLARGLTEHLVAAKADQASTKTLGVLGEAYLAALTGRGKAGPVGSVLNGPANTAWFDPWTAHLRSLGVDFRIGWTAERLRVEGKTLVGVTMRTPDGASTEISADWYVCAVDAPAARRLWNGDVRLADPQLGRMDELHTEWMSGIQFYLREPLDPFRGFVQYVDSPWALVSVGQARFWSGGRFADGFGDGQVRDCLSVNIGTWDAPGLGGSKPARKCSPAELAEEVWAQIQAAHGRSGPRLEDDPSVHSWFLDPAVDAAGGGGFERTAEPVLVNTAGSWAARPGARTAITNLFLAADYVRSTIDLATMEGANEAARSATNGILDASGSSAPRCRTFSRDHLIETWIWRRLDSALYRAGRPHLLDPRGYWRTVAAQEARQRSTSS
jgi:uncharacterized protein with NAD-binding domain and iron-sulfur cluster